MKKRAYSVAVVGATGLVGTEIIAALAERQFPLTTLQAYGSLHTAGDEVRCGGVSAHVELLEGARFGDTDLVFLAAGEQISAEWVGRITESGAVVIDTSSLFADDPDVPVVVPEVNAAELAAFTARGLVASPDPPAIALAVVLKPLHTVAGIRRVVAATFEPVSGAGRVGIEELQQQTIELMGGRSIETTVFPQRIAFNVIPQVGELLAGGASRDEQLTVTAVRRLLNDPALILHVTRVRTPIFFGTALSVNIETAEKLSAADAREVLRAAPGIVLLDELDGTAYPTPADAVGQDATQVGRIREDEFANAIDLWIAIDNVRKGSAVNAVEIAELLIRDYL
jgi:aspartate-semialdehyde dehydrogenase